MAVRYHVLHGVGTYASAGRCSQCLMGWKCVRHGVLVSKMCHSLALQTEIDHSSSSEPKTVVFGHLQPSSTTPPGHGLTEAFEPGTRPMSVIGQGVPKKCVRACMHACMHVSADPCSTLYSCISMCIAKLCLYIHANQGRMTCMCSWSTGLASGSATPAYTNWALTLRCDL